MSQQDLTADMLTRIRNSVRNRVESVDCLNNKLNQGVAQVLVDEGYVTRGRAETVYVVAFDADGAVDVAETERLRKTAGMA